MDGPLVLRVKFPADYRVAPHSNSVEEIVTIISGEAALYYFTIGTGSGVIADPEGVEHPDLQAVREEALAQARTMAAEGNQKGEERRGWCFEIMDRANQHVLTVAFSEAPHNSARLSRTKSTCHSAASA
ncbi:DUF6894 family protein [Microvirga massiliensis]|uniref:DUF6894 family protein n=1 Tax=Microvirga massiliensis TaxID=1033741 RepID=UPI00062BC3D2|nr:hypothetical protein [Microvirga massiliensis]